MPVAARIEADHIDAPGLVPLAARETQLVERNRHLHHVARLGDAAGRVPDRVPGRRLAAGDVVVEQVHLHAERVDEELEGPALVVEGVEDDADEVVVPGGVAVREVGADRLWIGVFRLETDVEVTVVVKDQGLGLHRGRLVLRWAGLVAERDDHRALPEALVQPAVDGDFAAFPPGDLIRIGGRSGRVALIHGIADLGGVGGIRQ